ncbi:hypothetical protein C8R46DRAFT_1030545 [Mycena filopes]|nr:hypothetical protein C8R46DRAFT_1030545 [Mycena filopes]
MSGRISVEFSRSSPLHRDKQAFHSIIPLTNSEHPTRLLGRISVRFPPLHRDKEAFNDDWNEFNNLRYSANKFGASNPLVRSNIRLVSCSSSLHRDKEASNDDWNEFSDLRYHANKFRPSTPHPTPALGRTSVRSPVRRSNIRSVSCSSYLPRVFVAFRDMDANDLELIHAYIHGIVIKCYDGIEWRVFPRLFTCGADYPENRYSQDGSKADMQKRAKIRDVTPWYKTMITIARR